jgi:hypothetical protein
MMASGLLLTSHRMKLYNSGHEISGLNPVARSESLAAILSRTDLIKKKKGQKPIAKLKYLVPMATWRPEISRPGII